MKKTNIVTLKAKQTYTIEAKRYTDTGKAVSHVSIRYESLNPEVATVSKKGKITAVGRIADYILASSWLHFICLRKVFKSVAAFSIFVLQPSVF